MLYMVIERYRNQDASAVYRRFRQQGRMMPEGLVYVRSWVDAAAARCFQLMACDDPRLLDEWTSHWRDLVDFEIVPVVTSEEAARAAAAAE
jgi:Domain of unknown function (DUF3303)